MSVTNLRILGKKPAAITPLSAVSSAPLAINVAVINVNFENDTSQPWTTDAIRNVMFANANAVSAYWAEVAYGKIAVRGDVYGWHTIPHDDSGCAYSTWATAAKNALAADGVDLAQYQKFVYAFQDELLLGRPRRRLAGLAQRHDLPARRRARGRTHAQPRALEEPELHAERHAGIARLRPLDVLGQRVRRPVRRHGLRVHATHVERRQGSARLDGELPCPDRHRQRDVRARLARRPGRHCPPDPARPSRRRLVAQPRGAQAVRPVLRHLPGERPGRERRHRPLNSTTTSASPQLVDCTPETTGFSDAALAAGKSLTDSAGGVQVTTLSVSSTGASVHVQLGGGSTPPADTQPPTAPSPLSATASSSTSASLSWPAATDNVGVANYRVFRNGALLATTTGRTYSDGGRTAGATYGYGVAAVDAAGNVGTTAEASVTMPTAADTQPPTAPTPLSANAASETTASLTWPAAPTTWRSRATASSATAPSSRPPPRARTRTAAARRARPTSTRSRPWTRQATSGRRPSASLTMPSAPPPPPPPPAARRHDGSIRADEPRRDRGKGKKWS